MEDRRSKARPKGDTTPELDSARVERILHEVSKVPIPWLLAMLVAALIATVDISKPSDGDVSIHVDVGTATLIALALIWLPVMLRVWVLTGGTLKGLGVEASATGLFSRDELVSFLAKAKAVTTSTADDERRQVAVNELDAYVERVAMDFLDSSRSLGDDALRTLAVQYERLRRDNPPGPERTLAMSRIVNECRVRAASSPTTAARKAVPLIRSRSQGDRIVGLALTQEAPGIDAFDEVLNVIQNSATAYELYNALLALQDLASLADQPMREHAITVLTAEREDPRRVGIAADPGMPSMIDDTIRSLSEA